MEELQKFFKFMKNVDTTGKIEFTIFVANESELEFLGLSFHIDEHNKICVDVFAKPTNSFTYVLPCTCYPKKNINNVPQGIALRLRRICDADKKLAIRSYEYQNYLIARDYKPTLVKRQFHTIKNINRCEARQVKPKVIKFNFNLINVYNPVMKKCSLRELKVSHTEEESASKNLSLLQFILELLQSLHRGLVSVIRVNVTYVRILRCSKMNSLVLLQVRHIR